MSSTQKTWNTAFTRLFRCRLPLLSAPMAGVSGGLLAAEVSRAGGLGMIAAGHFQNIHELEAEIEIFEERTRASAGEPSGLSIGFIGFSSLSTPEGWEKYERILRTHRPKAVQFFAPSIVTREKGPNNVELAHEHGAKFLAQVGSAREAKEAIGHGVDALICQGSEAGGHGLRRELGNSSIALASQASHLTDMPILAAGGIVTGKQLASALCVCDGASIGTRYWACHESLQRGPLQEELAKTNSCDDVIRTPVFDQIQNELSRNKWPHPYDSVGALGNGTTEEWDGKPSAELQATLDGTEFLERYKESKKAEDNNVVPILAGEGVGEIDGIEEAFQTTLRIEEEAIEAIDRLKRVCS